MSLVQYPDSDSDSDSAQGKIPVQPRRDPAKPGLKRKRSTTLRNDLPPLPTAFHDLYSTNVRVGTRDDPSLHGGRKRATPHVEGNWPSHVYLEWIPSQTETDCLNNLIEYVVHTIASHKQKSTIPELKSFLQSDLGVPLPLHISLSRTLQIKTEDRGPFLEILKSSLRHAAVGIFDAQFKSLKWVPNYERNRWFLVLSIKQPLHDELNRILCACNSAAKSCGHPALYTGGQGDGPKHEHVESNDLEKGDRNRTEVIDYSDYFHVSIAWNLTEPHPELVQLISEIDIVKHIGSPLLHFDAVKARIGNTVHSMPFKNSRKGSHSGGNPLGLS